MADYNPADPSTYSGVPDANFSPGKIATTGLGGPSTVGRYNFPIYAPDGTRLTDPNMVIPPGAQIYIGIPPTSTQIAAYKQGGGGGSGSGSGTSVVGGSDIVTQAAALAHQRAQDNIALMNAQANQTAAGRSGDTGTSAAISAGASERNASLAAQTNLQIAQMQHETDVATLGEKTANDLFNQRVAAIQAGLAANTANATQRNNLADKQLGILGLLASRSGPQDFVAYDRLLNGLNAGNPEKSQSLDVMSLLKDFYQPYSGDTLGLSPTLGQGANGAAPLPGTTQTGGGAGAGGATTPTGNGAFDSTAAVQTAINANPNALDAFGNRPASSDAPSMINGHPAEWYGGDTGTGLSSQYNDTSQPNYQPTYTGAAGEVAARNGLAAAAMPYGNDQINQGIPVPDPNLQRMAQGGDTSAAAIVGDGTGRRPARTAEIAMAMVDRYGRPVLHVLNPQQARPIINQSAVPRAASGGDFAGMAAYPGTSLTADQNTQLYQKDAAAGLPFGRQYARNYGPGGGTADVSAPTGDPGFREAPVAPPNGIDYGQDYRTTNLAAATAPAPAPPAGNGAFGQGGQGMAPAQPQSLLPVPQGRTFNMATAEGQQAYGDAVHPVNAGSITSAAQLADIQAQIAANRGPAFATFDQPAQPQPLSVGGVTINPGDWNYELIRNLQAANRSGDPSIAEALRAGNGYGGGWNLPRAATGGTYGTDLNGTTMTFNQYAPSDYGNLPFYRQLIGKDPSRSFGAFGATLDNPDFGIQNAPTAINLRNYNSLLPSGQDAFKSLYGQGLAVDPRDILAMAQNAAPGTHAAPLNRQVATVYGGQ